MTSESFETEIATASRRVPVTVAAENQRVLHFREKGEGGTRELLYEEE